MAWKDGEHPRDGQLVSVMEHAKGIDTDSQDGIESKPKTEIFEILYCHCFNKDVKIHALIYFNILNYL